MLCTICNDDIYENDEIKCSKCKIYLHFGCAGQREGNFRKLSQKAKKNWSCLKCKSSFAVNEIPIITTPQKIQRVFLAQKKYF